MRQSTLLVLVLMKTVISQITGGIHPLMVYLVSQRISILQTCNQETIRFLSKLRDNSGRWSAFDTSYVVINSRPVVELINSVPNLIYAYGPDNDLQSPDVYTLSYWHFDNSSDGKIVDYSFSNPSNDLTIQGNPYVVPGLFNNSLKLDGNLDSLSTPELETTGSKIFEEVTIEAWVYLDQSYVFDRNRVIFGGGQDGSLEIGVSVNREAYVTVYSRYFRQLPAVQ